MKPKDEDGAVSSAGWGGFGSGAFCSGAFGSGAGVCRKLKPLDDGDGPGEGIEAAEADPPMNEKLEDCSCALGGSGAAGAELVMKENADEEAAAASGASAGVEPVMNEKPDGFSSLSFDDDPFISNPPNIVQINKRKVHTTRRASSTETSNETREPQCAV
jgi:hypothetical protein